MKIHRICCSTDRDTLRKNIFVICHLLKHITLLFSPVYSLGKLGVGLFADRCSTWKFVHFDMHACSRGAPKEKLFVMGHQISITPGLSENWPVMIILSWVFCWWNTCCHNRRWYSHFSFLFIKTTSGSTEHLSHGTFYSTFLYNGTLSPLLAFPSSSLGEFLACVKKDGIQHIQSKKGYWAGS